MKKNIFLVIFICLVSCKSKEDKAKEAIKQFLFENLHDFKSYETVKFEKLDSAFILYSKSDSAKITCHKLLDTIRVGDSVFQKMLLYKNYEDSLNKFVYPFPILLSDDEKIKLIDTTKFIAKWAKENQHYFYERYRCQKRINTIDSIHEMVFKGYKMLHSYRCKTLGGNTRIFTTEFYFDTKMKITGEKNLDD